MNSLMQQAIFMTAKRLWNLCEDKRLIVYTAGLFLRAFLIVSIPFILGLFIDSLIYGGRPLLIFTVLVCIAAAAWSLDMFLRRSVIQIARKTELNLQCRLLDAVQRTKPSAIDAYKNGEVTIKFYRDVNVIEQFLQMLYPSFLNMFFGCIFAFVMVLCKKPVIAALYLFFLPLMFVCLLFFARKLTTVTHAVRFMYDHSINGIFEFMGIFPFLKSMAADEPYFPGPKSKFQIYRKINTLSDKIGMKLEYSNRFVLLLGEYSVLGIAGWMAWKKIIPIGDVVMFQVLFLSVLNSFSGMFQLLPNWKTTQESVLSVYELLDAGTAEDIECGEVVASAAGDITAENMTFRYPNSDRLIFDRFSCVIRGGSVTALTGANGAGKTTFLRLVTGYLEPTDGKVYIGGKDLAALQKKTFRRKIASVFQDSLLITGTIRDNITLKNSCYTEADIAEAARLAGADALIARLGLNHKIGAEGGGLSGGERQKLAIARALIRKPDILIFDEVTNHLDYESRIRMRDLIAEMHGKTTVLLVSHDPELVKLCDQEINLDEVKGQK